MFLFPEFGRCPTRALAMGKEGGYSASGAPQYGPSLFNRDASSNSAIRTIDGRRKHLDHILVDRLKANELTYGVAGVSDPGFEEAEAEARTRDAAAGSSRALDEGTSAPQEHEPYDPSDPRWFTPAFLVRNEGSMERAKKISGPRSPSGAVVSLENASIARAPFPSTRPTRDSYPRDRSAVAGAQSTARGERAE